VRRRFRLLQLREGERVGGVEQDCDALERRHDVAQQFEPLTGGVGQLPRESGGVAAGPRQTLDQAIANRIGRGCDHDRNR
jgi:hypothetical protein